MRAPAASTQAAAQPRPPHRSTVTAAAAVSAVAWRTVPRAAPARAVGFGAVLAVVARRRQGTRVGGSSSVAVRALGEPELEYWFDEPEAGSPARIELAARSSLPASLIEANTAELVLDILADDPGAATRLDANGQTLLFQLCHAGFTRAVRRVLAAAPRAATVPCGDACCADRWTPAHMAAWEGHAGVLRALLAAAPQLAATPTADGFLPIHVAASRGQVAAVQALLEAAAATAMARDRQHATPLHLAADAGRTAAVGVLLEAAPAAALMGGQHGQTPLHCAADAGRPATARLLLEAAPVAAYLPDECGWTPTLRACIGGHEAVVAALLAAAPVTASLAGWREDGAGLTPAHAAAAGGHVGILQRLLRAAPSADLAVESETYEEEVTPLEMAEAEGQEEAAAFLRSYRQGLALGRR